MPILLVRHAQSEANLKEDLFRTIGDHRIALSSFGREQAVKVGEFINNWMSINNPDKKEVRLWASPYLRTTQTAQLLYQNAPDVNWGPSSRGEHIFFDTRLREREFGYFDGLSDEQIAEKYPEEWAHYQKMMQENGRYYARPYGGESGANVAERLQTFKETLWRDIAKGRDYHVIVNHGFTLRCFVNSFLNLHPNFFAQEKNPSNTAVRLLDKDTMTGSYADYGYVYDPEKDIYIVEDQLKPVEYKLENVLDLNLV